MSKTFERYNFGRLPEVIDVPNLIEIQIKSYNDFLQKDVPPDKRENKGLQAVLNNIFPIKDTNNKFELEFIEYSVGEPKYTIQECQERDMTYAVPLKATMRLTVYDIDEDTKEREVKDIIEQQVYLGELPLITDRGTFIFNGAERVIINQLHRSPGVVFDIIPHSAGRKIYSGKLIPQRGSWLEFIIDHNNVANVIIDNSRKMNLCTFLRCLGYSDIKSILELFFKLEKKKVVELTTSSDSSDSGYYIVPPLTTVDGQVFLESIEYLTDALLKKIKEEELEEVYVLDIKKHPEAQVLINAFLKDSTKTTEEALIAFYSTIRPGNPSNIDAAKDLFERMFFNPKRYDLGNVGRFRLNVRLGIDLPEDQTTITNTDLVEIVRYLFKLWKEDPEAYDDDIDHLGNRRVRSVGELVAGQFIIAFTRMARAIREKMSLGDITTITPQDLISARTINSIINSFFGTSQLSQFMDQTNPLSEMTHKRRLSALGPGGLTRERAGFEVRDVHQSHYGRICPIETPEGQNIGLISSMCVYTRVNKYGFLETPYRRVINKQVTDEIVYLSAHEEERYIIAQANATVKDGILVDETVKARQKGEFVIARAEDVDFIDLSPKQIVSVAASLIPFLEHDDANRALMGSNMQRQAVPLLVSDSPIVGTGMEKIVARDSGSVIKAKRSGRVEYVSANKIIILPDERDESGEFPFDIYDLLKFKRTNQDTCINQRPIVQQGDHVEKDQIIADGSMTDHGELALGKNVVVAFLPWNGYNYEDAIIVSERLVKDDVFTSVHIFEHKVYVRDTKRGKEEITREIPNISEYSLSHLDKNGIVKIGSYVKPGDILVGKVTPKGETELTPEEKLLRAIFGEKAKDVKDTSLRVPPGLEGIVIDTKVFSRREHSEFTKKEEKQRIKKLEQETERNLKKLKEIRDKKLKKLLLNKLSNEIKHRETEEVILEKNVKLTKEILNTLDFDEVSYFEGLTLEPQINRQILEIYEEFEKTNLDIQEKYEKEMEKIIGKDELPPGILQLVKVYIAQKRKISVGDKMAGRHGNKGVVSTIVPEEDMPFLEDGRRVDIVLNPLGVPSRMNIGQLLETHLGWAAAALGYKVATPVFDGATISDIKEWLRKAGLSESGKSVLYDGKTGEPFKDKVTVGVMYMLKLSHMVEDKMHARSIGPYSLVTQQPLGGKAQFGGQRLGEMEVWALEAYGAAYCLQEMLTVKSDDVEGRSKIYEAIIKGENPPKPGVPESFNVLVKELQALALDVKIISEEEEEVDSKE